MGEQLFTEHQVTSKASGRLAKHSNVALNFSWPSGRGKEIGYAVAQISDVARKFRHHSGSFAGGPANVSQNTENGALAIVITDSHLGPISLAEVPEIETGKLAVVVDDAANTADVQRALMDVLPKNWLTFNPA